ncbi:alpha-ketoglutarate-dependent dioxygenase FTO [Hypomesus transpacificus]|uniref:alpha-ketoglutarate-dependent dioxygenase FTO n=1 Tax=Hypomesus transpacificus TaxID=137520 RepID=UPI001F076826|nr:alpha-ketoglutarate-dependent dioxygenase FTO [Hypomesus transpacificus]
MWPWLTVLHLRRAVTGGMLDVAGPPAGQKKTSSREIRRRLIQELGDQKIPFLGPGDQGFQQLWESSYSGLVVRRSCSLPTELHGPGPCWASRAPPTATWTPVSSPSPGTARIRREAAAAAGVAATVGVDGQSCCDADLRAACKALWELNHFFSSDVGERKEGDAFTQYRKEADTEAKLSEDDDKGSRQSDESKNTEGGDSESKQSEEGDTESKHSEEWDIESRHSDEGCSESKQRADWETEDKHSDEGEPEARQSKLGVPELNPRSEGKCTGSNPASGKGTEAEGATLGCQEKPVAELKHSLSSYHIQDEEEEEQSGQGCSGPPQAPCPGPAHFNVTLLNYMDPSAISQLKEEPYYGMGKMAVGWHHDENLVTRSPVAVYSYSCHDNKGVSPEEGSGEKGCWRIGLKVAWDIHTPGLTLPLQSGDCYYLRDDLNRSHQHCVLTGDMPRFSSTHRVAECSTGTLAYIEARCREALSNLRVEAAGSSHSLLSLLPSTFQHCEEIHNEVEFEWLRQYWFQGQRYTRFCSWWSGPMERLETDWRHMELMTKLFLAVVEDEESAEEGRREMAETLLSALTDRQQHRQTWRDRCHSTLAQSLPPEEVPVDRPFWGLDDAAMPLPFDLADIINRVESLLWRM